MEKNCHIWQPYSCFLSLWLYCCNGGSFGHCLICFKGCKRVCIRNGKAMAGSLLVLLGALSLSSTHYNGHRSDNITYYAFPKFWTNCGFCPAGRVTHMDIKESLLSDAMKLNLAFISGLPKGSVTHLRIHWLLELLEFIQFTQSELAVIDFSVLDQFLIDLNDMDLYPVVEFMGNFSDLFMKNPTYNGVIWEDLSFQFAKHYLNLFGAKTVLKWRFESWNEPDLLVYNKLNFTLEDYITYMTSVKHGLKRAGSRPEHSLHIPLRGPAGIFKNNSHHQLCWGILKYCNDNTTLCPIDVLTYHRKGNGTDTTVILDKSRRFLSEVYELYPLLRSLPFSNDEADPISGWSVGRSFQEDVRYAIALVDIVLDHWSSKLNSKDFSNMETISHDNAFLSYHPHEFSQRTLLAHFRMNNTNPPHSQFIQKPVYAAMGLLSRLADIASDTMEIKTLAGLKLKALITTTAKGKPGYISLLVMPLDQRDWKCDSETCYDSIPLPNIHLCDKEVFAFIVESIDQKMSNPVKVWRAFKRPPYPNTTVREEMRRHQSLQIQVTGVLKEPKVVINYAKLLTPWITLLRICSNLNGRLKQPQKLQLIAVTHNEVLLTWKEYNAASSNCLKTYEVWFRPNVSQEWYHISSGWHIPFPLFQYVPINGATVNGFYKVRGIDVFNSTSPFSTQIQYIEI